MSKLTIGSHGLMWTYYSIITAEYSKRKQCDKNPFEIEVLFTSLSRDFIHLMYKVLSRQLNLEVFLGYFFVTGETVPEGERMLNAKDNRNSQVFESLALLDQPAQPAVSDKERKKFEDEKSKLYMQMDEKVCGEKKQIFFLYRLSSC